MSNPRSVARARLVGWSFLLGLIATVGCAGGPIAVSPSLAESTTRFPEDELDRRSFDLGEYQVREIRRGREKGIGRGIGDRPAIKSRREFSFTIANQGSSMQVQCLLTQEAATTAFFIVEGVMQLVCELEPAQAQTPWRLLFVQKYDSPAQGRLQQGSRELQVVSTHASGHPKSRGYSFREQADVAAVDVGRETKAVWLPKAADPELSLALAGASVSLMLYERLR